jgi:hypothetical protein
LEGDIGKGRELRLNEEYEGSNGMEITMRFGKSK